MTHLSSDTVHATTVVRSDHAVMIGGKSGSGKSDVALQLIDRGYTLVSDDQTMLSCKDDELYASAPPSISGKMEIRGLGIVDMPVKEDVRVCLYVALGESPDRLPPDGDTEQLMGCDIPRMALMGNSPSAAIRIDMALDRIGIGAP